MKNRTKGRKLHRTTGPRKHLLNNQVASLILHDQITTTKAKAKETRVKAEKIITKAKRNTLQDIRLIRSTLPKNAASRLLSVIVPAITHRTSGYTRLLGTTSNRQDNSTMALLEFTDTEKIREFEKKLKTEKGKEVKKKKKSNEKPKVKKATIEE